MAELKFEITKELGVLSTNAKGWTKELTWFLGMKGNRSMIYESGTPTTQEWEKALHLPKKKLNHFVLY